MSSTTQERGLKLKFHEDGATLRARAIPDAIGSRSADLRASLQTERRAEASAFCWHRRRLFQQGGFLGRGCLLCFHSAAAAAASSLRSSQRPAEASARCVRGGGGGTEERRFLKQLFTQETAFAAAENSRRITDEALCRWDEINQIANEQYVNAMLY